MVRAIFWRWHYLQQIFNIDHDANEIFSFRLRTYFKKSSEEDVRCYTRSFVKTWIFGKRKSYSDDLVHATVERGVMAWGVENHLPLLQDGEDQNIISAHRVKLASQFNLTEEKRDPHTIRNSMNLTFPHRRQLLIQGMSTIREVIDLYPILQNERQVYLNPCDFTTDLLTLKKLFCMGLMTIGRS